MFEADSQNFASAPSLPRGFELQKVLARLRRGPREEGGPRQTPLPPPPPPLLIHPLGVVCLHTAPLGLQEKALAEKIAAQEALPVLSEFDIAVARMKRFNEMQAMSQLSAVPSFMPMNPMMNPMFAPTMGMVPAPPPQPAPPAGAPAAGKRRSTNASAEVEDMGDGDIDKLRKMLKKALPSSKQLNPINPRREEYPQGEREDGLRSPSLRRWL